MKAVWILQKKDGTMELLKRKPILDLGEKVCELKTGKIYEMVMDGFGKFEWGGEVK